MKKASTTLGFEFVESTLFGFAIQFNNNLDSYLYIIFRNTSIELVAAAPGTATQENRHEKLENNTVLIITLTRTLVKAFLTKEGSPQNTTSVTTTPYETYKTSSIKFSHQLRSPKASFFSTTKEPSLQPNTLHLLPEQHVPQPNIPYTFHSHFPINSHDRDTITSHHVGASPPTKSLSLATVSPPTHPLHIPSANIALSYYPTKSHSNTPSYHVTSRMQLSSPSTNTSYKGR